MDATTCHNCSKITLGWLRDEQAALGIGSGRKAIDFPPGHVRLNNLRVALREAEASVGRIARGVDPLAVHIFLSRRHYRNIPDTKSGKWREVSARLKWADGVSRLAFVALSANRNG